MRTFHRNWITYDMAFGHRVCIPQKNHCGYIDHRHNLCCDMLNLFCKYTMNSYRHNYRNCRNNEFRGEGNNENSEF